MAVGGDFNDITRNADKTGGAQALRRNDKIFRDIIHDCKFLDIETADPKFTWKGPVFHSGLQIYEKLDRDWSNDFWNLAFVDAKAKVVPRVEFSDHHPLLITPVKINSNIVPRAFRFESAWMTAKSYKEMINNCWKINENMHTNLQDVKEEIQHWKFHAFNQVIK